MRIKPLKELIADYFRQPIPLMAWSLDLIEIFNDMKICITSSLVLARFDPSKLIFQETDWSMEGMGYILMQPTTDEVSTKAAILLHNGGPCLFDTDARLKTVVFESRFFTGLEK